MDRQRVILAVFLMLLVWLAPMLIWPPKPADRRLGGSADSIAVRDSVAAQRPVAPPALTAQAPNRLTDDTARIV